MADKPDRVTAGPDQRGARTPGRLERVLAAAEFAVTAEIGPPRGADAEPVRRKAALLRDWVDAVNLTDNQSATVRLASWAASLAALAAGVEPIMQLTCRDRNRIALQSELISAAAMGIPNVLLMTGDDPRHGDHPDATPVFDIDSTQLMRVARTMRDEGLLMSGRKIDPAPSWFIGAVESHSGPADSGTGRLAAKVAAGAQFVQTQFVFDVPAFSQWMAQVRDLGLSGRCYVLAGVGIIRSHRALDFFRDKLPGVHVPADVYRRLRAVPADQTAAEGARLAAETVAQVAEIPGVAGVHLLTAGSEHAVPGILDGAGIRADRGRDGG
jgi:methylenetetrahydrofolate reductase (NADPH)